MVILNQEKKGKKMKYSFVEDVLCVVLTAVTGIMMFILLATGL